MGILSVSILLQSCILYLFCTFCEKTCYHIVFCAKWQQIFFYPIFIFSWTASIFSWIFVKSKWVYTSNVTDTLACPMIYCNHNHWSSASWTGDFLHQYQLDSPCILSEGSQCRRHPFLSAHSLQPLTATGIRTEAEVLCAFFSSSFVFLFFCITRIVVISGSSPADPYEMHDGNLRNLR